MLKIKFIIFYLFNIHYLLNCSVKDHVRMRLMESGWTNNLTHYVKNRIAKRLEAGQTKNSIKFEQLYDDVITRARCKNLTILSNIRNSYLVFSSINYFKTK